MAEQITITVPDGTSSNLEELARERGVSRDDLAREAFESLLFFSRFEIPFRSLHESMVDQAKGRGVVSEDDVFGQVS